jgi:hypothetical protein
MSTGIYVKNAGVVSLNDTLVVGFDSGVVAEDCTVVAIANTKVLEHLDDPAATDNHGVINTVKKAFATVGANAAGSIIGNLVA